MVRALRCDLKGRVAVIHLTFAAHTGCGSRLSLRADGQIRLSVLISKMVILSSTRESSLNHQVRFHT